MSDHEGDVLQNPGRGKERRDSREMTAKEARPIPSRVKALDFPKEELEQQRRKRKM